MPLGQYDFNDFLMAEVQRRDEQDKDYEEPKKKTE